MHFLYSLASRLGGSDPPMGLSQACPNPWTKYQATFVEFVTLSHLGHLVGPLGKHMPSLAPLANDLNLGPRLSPRA